MYILIGILFVIMIIGLYITSSLKYDKLQSLTDKAILIVETIVKGVIIEIITVIFLLLTDLSEKLL